MKAKSTSYRHDAVFRARVLVRYSSGESKTSIAESLHVGRPLIYRCIDKAVAFGLLESLNNLAGRGAKNKISDEAVAWVVNAAC